MYKNFPYIAITIVLLYALYNTSFKKKQQIKTKINHNYTTHIQEHHTSHFKEELARIKTVEYTKQYIIDVINYGSHQFEFPGGEMEAGFASFEDAPKIACYVLEFSGKKCQNPYPKDAAMFFSSNCAGCHGEDAKGLNGSFPNLTRKKLLGIEKKEAFLKNMLKK